MTIRRQQLHPPRARHDAVARFARVALTAATTLLLTGCLTVARGTKQRVLVTSQPPGATVAVDGAPIGVTPAIVNVSRGSRHTVTLIKDSLRADTTLTRVPSLGLLVYLLFPVPGLLFAGVDLLTGAGVAVKDADVMLYRAQPGAATVIAGAPALTPTTPVVRELPVVDEPLKRDDRLRIAPANPGEPVKYMVVDSADPARIYGRSLPFPDAMRPDPTPVVVGADDTRSIAHYLPPDRRAAGWDMTRHSVRGIVPFLAFPQGGAVALIAYPAGLATGATLAEPRWAPREARRVGSPFLVDDRLQVRFKDEARGKVSGRLVDMDRTDLILTSGGSVVRVPRKDIAGVKRSNGYDYGTAAILGTLAGLGIGQVACSKSDICRRSGAGDVTIMVSTALFGLLASPAIAPRRWSDVARW
jgi:hypothetical protein